MLQVNPVYCHQTPGNKLEGDTEDIVSLQAQTTPYFQLRAKFKCIEHTDKSETQFKTSQGSKITVASSKFAT